MRRFLCLVGSGAIAVAGLAVSLPSYGQSGMHGKCGKTQGPAPFSQGSSMKSPFGQGGGMPIFMAKGSSMPIPANKCGTPNPFGQGGGMPNPMGKGGGMPRPFAQGSGMFNPLSQGGRLKIPFTPGGMMPNPLTRGGPVPVPMPYPLAQFPVQVPMQYQLPLQNPIVQVPAMTPMPMTVTYVFGKNDVPMLDPFKQAWIVSYTPVRQGNTGSNITNQGFQTYSSGRQTPPDANPDDKKAETGY